MTIFWLTEVILRSLAEEPHRASFSMKVLEKEKVWKGGLESFTASRDMQLHVSTKVPSWASGLSVLWLEQVWHLRVYSWDFLLIPLVLLALVQNSKIWAYQNKISAFKDASYKNSKYTQSDLISTINYSWAKWESPSQKYEKCLRPQDCQSIQYKIGGPQAENIFFKIQSASSGNSTKSGFPVLACACTCAACARGAGQGVQAGCGHRGLEPWKEGGLCAARAGPPARPHWPRCMFLTHSVCHQVKLPRWSNNHVFLIHAWPSTLTESLRRAAEQPFRVAALPSLESFNIGTIKMQCPLTYSTYSLSTGWLICRTSSILSNCFHTMTMLLCEREETHLKDTRTQAVKGRQRASVSHHHQALRNIRAFPCSQRQGALSHIFSFEQAVFLVSNYSN